MTSRIQCPECGGMMAVHARVCRVCCSPEPRAVVTVTVVEPPVGWEKAPKRRKGA